MRGQLNLHPPWNSDAQRCSMVVQESSNRFFVFFFVVVFCVCGGVRVVGKIQGEKETKFVGRKEKKTETQFSETNDVD